MIHTDGIRTIAHYPALSRDDVIELAASTDIDGMAAEIFVRLDIDQWDLLLAEADA